MDPPDPILPQSSIWPVALLSLLVTVGILTAVHAGRRGRWLWATAVVLAVPLALPLYWLGEARVRRVAAEPRRHTTP